MLSLFDGISCGMLALQRAGVNVEVYNAYEIDNDAIKVSEFNFFGKINHCGDVRNCFCYPGQYDLLIGGSPCQDLSSMGSHKGLDGEKSGLFFEYLRIKNELKPKYFLLENNASMSDASKQIITNYMGVEPILINSSSFSAQNRKRLYWTNIPVLHYNNKSIVLYDILDLDEERININDKIKKYLGGEYHGRKIETNVRHSYCDIFSKTRTIGTKAYDIGSNTGIYTKLSGKYVMLTQTEFERLQTLPDGYTKCLPYNKAVKCIGNGWTVDVIAHIFKGLRPENSECYRIQDETC